MRLTGSPLHSQRWAVRMPYRRYLEISFHPVRITGPFYTLRHNSLRLPILAVPSTPEKIFPVLDHLVHGSLTSGFMIVSSFPLAH